MSTIAYRFGRVPETLLYSDASDRACRLHALLTRWADTRPDEQPTREKLAKQLRCSVDSADRAVKELQKHGVLQVERDRYDPETKAQLPNRYVLEGAASVPRGGRTRAAPAPPAETDETAGDRGRTSAQGGGRTGAAPYKERDRSKRRTEEDRPPKKGRPPAPIPEVAWDLARLLAESVERRFPQFGKPKAGIEWARDIDLLMRKGPPGFEKGLDEQQIRKLIDWLDTSRGERAQFWAPNIRSAEKLRAKAPDLVAGWHKDHGRQLNGNGGRQYVNDDRWKPATTPRRRYGEDYTPEQKAELDRLLEDEWAGRQVLGHNLPAANGEPHEHHQQS